MEGGREDSDEDVREEGETTLLWEKCIQQRIVVDLSEDESRHLSDLLASSLALQLSRAECAVSEASNHFRDDLVSDSILVRSERARPSESSALRNEELLSQRHDEDPGQNTSDEDQEELPYDGDLGSPYFNCMDRGQPGNVISDGRQTATTHLDLVSARAHVEEEEKDEQDEDLAPPCSRPPVDIHKMLLRHFSQEELQQSGRLIEAETLPEVSLLDSVDDPHASISTRNNTAVESSISDKTSVGSFSSNGNSASKRERLEEANTASGRDASAATPAKCDERDVRIKVSHLRSRSFGELKYGQGQVHYPLPDFSKVAPKVKIPKGPSGPKVIGPMIRAQSSPGMLQLISRVLEDCGLQPAEVPQVLKDTHDQAEYDKLVSKYGRAENLIDKMRLGTDPSSDICIEADPVVGPAAPHIPTLGMFPHTTSDLTTGRRWRIYILFPRRQTENIVEKLKTAHEDAMKPNVPDQDAISEAEKMTAELTAVISQFMQTVDEFKRSVNNMSASTDEQQTMLRSLMEAQDQLERKYMSKKEEHRALEMRNYLGLRRNVGTFDPNRLVEGDIFRVGMQLEDIKEMIEKNTRQLVTPPLFSSTPATKKLPLKASPPTSLHEGSSVSSTAECFRRKTKTEAQKEDESGKNDGSEESSQLTSKDSMQVINRFCFCPEGPPDAEDEENRDEERKSATLEGRASSDIWSIISGKWTSGSGTQDGVLKQECDVDVGVIPAVEVSAYADAHSSLPQAAACRETDSGFGSSDLNQSTGILTLDPSIERFPRDELCTPNSEGSALGLLTTIHPKDESSRRQKLPVQAQPGSSAAAVDQWVQSTIKKSSLELQGPDASNHLTSEPIVSPAMDAEQRERHLCSCNSEALLALQVEVSRLKKDLEEGLVQLPHLARKMDYLASKYRQDRQERRSKAKGRTHRKLDGLRKSAGSGQSLSNFNSSQLRLEDWISTDMESSKSKEAIMDDLNSKDSRRLLRTSQPSQRPLLQVSYGSSCSLPASYKVKEPAPHVTNHRKRSTQSDTALLPMDVYFQHTLSPVLQWHGSRTRSKKEEEMNRTLDRAIEAARSMKRTTDRMAKRLTADLAKAQLLPQGNVRHSAARAQESLHGLAQKENTITRERFFT
ncbi:uncharacterized protein aknad1 [Festucalex cinctus]